MERTRFDSLTPSERTILRELLVERDQKAVARSLGLSPETVKTHLRNAREKCGAHTSFALAKEFALHEGAPPQWGITPKGGGFQDHFRGTEAMPAQTSADERWSDEVREVRTSFAFDRTSDFSLSVRQDQEDAGRTTIQRLFSIAALALLLVLLIILAFPLSESFQRFANLIDPPTRHVGPGAVRLRGSHG